MAHPSPVPVAAAVELDRLSRRWTVLPLPRAVRALPAVRALLDELARPPGVPDLGPEAVMDQLTVLVWDAYAAGRGDGVPERLAALRREIS